MGDKMAISDYILKIVEKDPFLRLQMRAEGVLNRLDSYLNNFQEHLFGMLRLRKYQTSLQNFFPT